MVLPVILKPVYVIANLAGPVKTAQNPAYKDCMDLIVVRYGLHKFNKKLFLFRNLRFIINFSETFYCFYRNAFAKIMLNVMLKQANAYVMLDSEEKCKIFKRDKITLD